MLVPVLEFLDSAREVVAENIIDAIKQRRFLISGELVSWCLLTLICTNETTACVFVFFLQDLVSVLKWVNLLQLLQSEEGFMVIPQPDLLLYHMPQ